MSTSSPPVRCRPARRRARPALKNCRITAPGPMCRRAFTRVVGPGRPQAFCSEVCRRAAEKELRQARSMLAHFEDLTAQLRVDIAAFGRGGLGLAERAHRGRITSHKADSRRRRTPRQRRPRVPRRQQRSVSAGTPGPTRCRRPCHRRPQLVSPGDAGLTRNEVFSQAGRSLVLDTSGGAQALRVPRCR